MAPKTTPSPRSGGKASPTAGKGARAGGSSAAKRKPVRAGRNWGMIALGAAVAVAALAIIAYPAYQAFDNRQPYGQQADQRIEGITNFRETDPDSLTRNHTEGIVEYAVSPPVGGDHNAAWETCEGNIYTQPIPSEHAVHSMEHGAVWITYDPELPADQIETLQEKVEGNEYMLISPFPDLDRPISLQAWGFQLKLDSADDGRVDDFIRAFRGSATVEPGATCAGGVTVTGDTPESQQAAGGAEVPAGGAPVVPQ